MLFSYNDLLRCFHTFFLVSVRYPLFHSYIYMYICIRLRKVDASQIHIYQFAVICKAYEYRALFPLAMFSLAQVYSSSNVDGLDVMAI